MIMIVIFNLFYSESYVSCGSNNYKKAINFKSRPIKNAYIMSIMHCLSCRIRHLRQSNCMLRSLYTARRASLLARTSK